jgi:hypothetical protein
MVCVSDNKLTSLKEIILIEYHEYMAWWLSKNGRMVLRVVLTARRWCVPVEYMAGHVSPGGALTGPSDRQEIS